MCCDKMSPSVLIAMFFKPFTRDDLWKNCVNCPALSNLYSVGPEQYTRNSANLLLCACRAKYYLNYIFYKSFYFVLYKYYCNFLFNNDQQPHCLPSALLAAVTPILNYLLSCCSVAFVVLCTPPYEPNVIL